MVAELWVLVGAPVARSVAGWLENALEDGKISLFELQKLATTVVKLGVPGLFLYFGLDLDANFAAALPVIVDYAFSWLRK